MKYPEKIINSVRKSAAFMWLIAALFALPLAFLRLNGAKVPLFGVAEAVTLPLLAVLAAAILLTCGGIGQLYRNFSWRIFGAAQVLLAVSAGWHFFVGRMNVTDAGMTLFFILAPTVGAVLKREFKQVLPLVGGLTALLLIYSGFASENFTGFTGNWNWTQGLLFALLPGIFLLRKLRKWQYFAMAAVVVMAAVVYLLYPGMFSYGAAVAVVAAAAVLFLAQLLSWHWKWRIFGSAAVMAVAGFAVLLTWGDFDDSRFQLWKGAGRMVMERGITGFGQFGNQILTFLPEKYYFTSHAAIWHPHPHNEILNFLCLYGIAGGIFLTVLLYLVLRHPAKDDRELFARWVFLVLFFCGMFDMHCVITMGAVWAFTCAGITGGAPVTQMSRRSVSWQRYAVAGMLLIAFTGLVLNHYRAGVARRHGELALMQGKKPEARAHFIKSLKYEKSSKTLYLLAEQELLAERSYYAKILLDELERQKLENYCHARRLRAMCEFYLGDKTAAQREIEAECRNYPFSIISARSRWQILQACGAPAAELNDAQAYFYGLCKLRNITPLEALKLSPAVDDRPLKNPAP